MQLMLESCLVSTGTNTALAFLQFEVAASHAGCPVRNTSNEGYLHKIHEYVHKSYDFDL